MWTKKIKKPKKKELPARGRTGFNISSWKSQSNYKEMQRKLQNGHKRRAKRPPAMQNGFKEKQNNQTRCKTIPRDIKRLRGDSKRPQVTTCKRCERKGNTRRPQTKQTNAKQLNGDTERPQVDKKQPQKDEKQLQMISTRNAKRQQRNTKQQKTQNSRKKDENRLQTDHTDAQPHNLNRIDREIQKKNH